MVQAKLQVYYVVVIYVLADMAGTVQKYVDSKDRILQPENRTLSSAVLPFR